MLDPFIAPPPLLIEAIKPISNYLSFSTLPFHIHEILLSYLVYQTIFSLVAPRLSSYLAPQTYHGLSANKKVNWNVHVTSQIQSTFICSLALWVIWTDNERAQMDWTGRIWGYTGAMGLVQALAAGYFVWDVVVSAMHFRELGPGSLAHAVSALLVTSLGFLPFANYYGLNFILYELSTPFLNMHWFMDKMKMTGSRMQLYNGIALITAFFGARVIWGNYQSVKIYTDVWSALNTPTIDLETAKRPSVFAYRNAAGINTTGNSQDMKLPMWLVILYLGSNTLLNFLNIYWFSKMITAMRKRFDPALEKKKK